MDCIRYRSLVIEPLECRIAPAFVTPVNLPDLDGTNGFKIQGEAAGDSFGFAVNGAGDVNGDGLADVIIGARGADGNGMDSGAIYVVFGKRGGFGATLNLATLDGTNGFKLVGEAVNDRAGGSVSGVGDVNGDGFDDLIVGDPFTSPNGSRSGASYVVFGKAGGFAATLNLSALDGTNGFKIQGEAAGDFSGILVSGAGDLNGDGLKDLLVGASFAKPKGTYSGASYVVFGRATGFDATLNLSALDGANGFKILSEGAGDLLGEAGTGAGDVNGDGFGDLILGARGVDQNGESAGATYVVFGKGSGFDATLELSTLDGTNGFKLLGEAAYDLSGVAASGAGDVNGDGFADLIVGASGQDVNGSVSGAAYVVFGASGGFGATVNLAALDGTNGFKLAGEEESDLCGFAASGAGDVNGDGFADVIVGAYRADPNGNDSGAAYVVYGKPGRFAAALNLSALNGSNGFKLLGEAVGDRFGVSVRGAGDVNGDGFADLIVGADRADPNGSESGASYVVFGQPDVKVSISLDRKSATFVDSDGDLATMKISKGALSQRDFIFRGGVWQGLDLATKGAAIFGGATVAVTVKKGFGGDGRVNLGYFDATGLDLGAVTIAGDLGQIDAGDANLKTPAVKSLTVGSLGVARGTQPTGILGQPVSDLVGTLGKLTVKGTVKGAIDIVGGTLGSVVIGGDLDGSAGGSLAGVLRATGDIGAVAVKGSIVGGADLSGLSTLAKLGRVTIGGDLTSADLAKPVIISAQGKLGATKAADAVAIAGVSVKGNVLNARILAGFDVALAPTNADAGIGAISAGKNWAASSVAAGVADSTGDGFGQNDTRIDGDASPKLVAAIASITIKGTASGSTSSVEFYGITAERIGKAKIGGTNLALTKGADEFAIDPTNNNFRLVDFA